MNMKKLKVLVLLGMIVFSLNLFSRISEPSNDNTDSYLKYIRQDEINEEGKIKNVIVFIGDGMGPNHVSAGAIRKGEPLCFADPKNSLWSYHAYSNTDSLTSQGFTLDESKSLLRPDLNPSLYDSTPSPYDENTNLQSGSITGYTDSAAGGSAIATGKKLTNSRVGMDILGRPIPNLVEIASSLGKKTGVLTTDNLAGATPASFMAHVGERHYYDDIIKSIAESPTDLIIAQNLSNWTSKESEYKALYEKKGFEVNYDFQNLDTNAKRSLLLLDAILPFGDRTPSLAALTVFALDFLDQSEEGFFLMVEGSNIDKQSHANQAMAMLNELLGFEEAIKAAELWASSRDDTIIVVTADHETGALTYDRSNTNSENIADNITFLSTNHSRTRVRIDILGDISDFITTYSSIFSELEGVPYWENTDIFNLCVSYL